jgi:hypothetical protein
MSKYVVVVVGLLGMLGSILAAQDLLGERRDPVTDLRSHVERIAGREPSDCGQFQHPSRGSGEPRIEREALERAIACARDSSIKRKPFWIYIGGYGIDSWLATGVIGTSDGTMFTFSYDSNPCGGPNCSSRLTPIMCVEPTIREAQNRSYYIVCADRAVK